MNLQELKDACTYVHSELNRIETIAGTLSTVEREHYRKLTNFDNRDLTDLAVEEQSAARQLGAVKEICLALAQRVGEIKSAADRGGFGEAADHAQGH